MATEDGSQKTARRRNNREAHRKRDREENTERDREERGGEGQQAQLSSTRGESESESEICQTHNDFGFFTRIFFFWTLRNDL